ncbi:MAG: SDR family oxidoreductase [Leptolyngbyaceae cyanobacterium SM1_1_3]|nr:SDR family oxidoreductase [Leptolyngbyaceae cyanobacterium SM1_1_3]NJN02785.1 SDR family oxidoreductase [Leptolyngbyaceae cyanobacterium RM1_1_2]NJO11364.1 SDR family oxidoreductase [Leptolyngbyaceae cyanobacterium SL_1_1]
MTPDSRVALVTGSNRGIGFETVRQLAKHDILPILTSREPEPGEAAAAKLRQQGLAVEVQPLSVSDSQSVEALAQFIRQRFGRLDILVNNAGIYSKADGSILNVDLEVVRATLETNVYGILRVTQALVPLLRQSSDGRIINVSSGMGQLSDMGGGATAYRLSKVAVNGITKILDAELADSAISVNSVCPGWVKTDMGGAEAPRSPEQGADTVVWLATQADKPSGQFWRDRQPLAW